MSFKPFDQSILEVFKCCRGTSHWNIEINFWNKCLNNLNVKKNIWYIMLMMAYVIMLIVLVRKIDVCYDQKMNNDWKS